MVDRSSTTSVFPRRPPHHRAPAEVEPHRSGHGSGTEYLGVVTDGEQ